MFEKPAAVKNKTKKCWWLIGGQLPAGMRVLCH